MITSIKRDLFMHKPCLYDFYLRYFRFFIACSEVNQTGFLGNSEKNGIVKLCELLHTILL